MEIVKIGFGFDSHRLVKGRPLILGGVKMPFSKGLLGHSDADVLIHALIDALLGAAGLGDIGRHFPDSDAKYKGISSLKLLGEVKRMLARKRLRAVNVDCTIVTEKPKIKEYSGEMTKNIAETIGLPVNNINIKAKSNEGMGFIGRGEGMAAFAVALIKTI